MIEKYIHINCDNPDCTNILEIPLKQTPDICLAQAGWIIKIENGQCVAYCNYHIQGGWWEKQKGG